MPSKRATRALEAGTAIAAAALLAWALWPDPLALPPATVPGATNPDVMQINIRTTICNRAWVRAQRPAEAISEGWKRALLPRGTHLADWQLDHLVPLELGGAAASMQNLWMQPASQARIKDRLENRLNDLVCAGAMPLTKAQQCIATNWVDCYDGVMK